MLAGTEMKSSWKRSHESNGVVQQYHDPLRKIYTSIQQGYTKVDPEISLWRGIKGINDSMGPEGLELSYLMVGIFRTVASMNKNLRSQELRMEALSP